MQRLHPAIAPAPLVGRALHMEALHLLLAEAGAGRGRCILVSGEAGVGKSRLLREFVAGARAAGVRVLQGACLENDTALAYGPLADALRSVQAAALPAHLAAELARLLPELALVRPDLPVSAAPPPDLDKRRFFEAFVHALAHLAAPPPLLLTIEDIHWSDEASLEALAWLARRLPALPIFLLLTVRPQAAAPALDQFLSQLNRARLAQELRLEPLAPDGVAALLRTMFAWELPLKQPFVDAIYALTEGNPFYVEEVANALVVSGDIYFTNGNWHYRPRTQLTIPHSLRLIVQQRTDLLSPEAANLLAMAAVAGRTFDFDLLARLTGADEATLLHWMEELVVARLVVEESADTFAFRHALTREAIYAGLLTRARRTQHAAIAHYYAEEAAQQERRLPQLSYHFFEAGLWEQTLRYGQAAGEQAQRRFAPQTALLHYARVAIAADQLGRPLPGAVRQLRAQAQQMVGNLAATQIDFELLLAEARASGDAQAEWQALHDLGFLWMTRDFARTGDYLQQALAVARTLDAPAVLAQSLNRLGNWRANIGQPLAALTLHQEALAIFETAQNQPGIAATLDLIATAHGITGNVAASVEHYRRALHLLEVLGDRQGVASALTMLAPDGYIAEGERAVAIARAIDWRDGEANAQIRLAFAHLFRGEFGPALAHVDQGLRLAQEIDHIPWQTAAYQCLGMTELYMLATEEAIDHLRQALHLARASGAQVWVDAITGALGMAQVAGGDLAGAAALLAAAPAPLVGLESLGRRLLALAQGELALAQRQPAAALAVVDAVFVALPDLRTWEDRTLCYWLDLQGRALAAANRLEAAVTALQAAIALCAQYDLQMWRWRCHADLSRVHLSRKDRLSAAAEAATARAQLDLRAATIPDPEQRRRFQQAAAARLPQPPTLTPLQQSKQAFGNLTQREREIALLVARGKTNKEIASELTITVRTTKSHLTNILTKLNFTSRSQIAAWAAAIGLLDLE